MSISRPPWRATSASEESRVAVLRLMQTAVRGDFPHLPRLLDARLFPLEKPSGRVRPIAVGELWYWLTALCALVVRPGSAALPRPAAYGRLNIWKAQPPHRSPVFRDGSQLTEWGAASRSSGAAPVCPHTARAFGGGCRDGPGLAAGLR
jgi:hypothetical protein